MKKRLLTLLITGLCWMPSSHAANGIAIEAGLGDDSTDMGQFSLIHQWDSKWFTEGNWYLTGYWEASLGHWHSSNAGGNEIWNVGLTPVFRVQSKATGGLRPYFEAAIGANLISDTHVNNERNMGVAYQFGDHLGLGMILGDRGQYELGYRFQHFSQAGINHDNDGINFQEVRFVFLF